MRKQGISDSRTAVWRFSEIAKLGVAKARAVNEPWFAVGAPPRVAAEHRRD
jgi:hypothetical protein